VADARQLRDQDQSPFGFRYRTAREAVAASQRGRMLDAITKIVAEKGYGATTIADVVSRAGVSRRAFYEQFRDVETCLLAAFDAGASFVLSRIEQELAAVDATDWRKRAGVLIELYLAILAAEPEFAQVLHVDVLAAGQGARARWAQALQHFVALYRALNAIAREEDPAIPHVSDKTFLVLAGGIAELVREYARTGRLGQLPELAPMFTALAVAIVSGAGEAEGATDHTQRTRSAKP